MTENLNTIAYYATTPAEAEREIKRRDDLIAVVEEFEKMPTDGGFTDEVMQRVVPIPNSDNVLGHLKGEVEIEFRHRVVGTLTWADLQAVDEFWDAWVRVQEDELRLFDDLMKLVEGGNQWLTSAI